MTVHAYNLTEIIDGASYEHTIYARDETEAKGKAKILGAVVTNRVTAITVCEDCLSAMFCHTCYGTGFVENDGYPEENN
jgi:hypothetical protein